MTRDARSGLRSTKHAEPLAGLRILTLAQNVPGPVAVARLVRQGASAVKIEPPGGDLLAGISRAWYRRLHRRVAIEPCDLKSEAGRDRVWHLLAKSDLLITSQRPGALKRLGLDTPMLAERAPHLRVLQIVGDTETPDEPGHDLTYQAKVGLIGAEMPRTLVADLFGAERAVAAALLLLRRQAPATVRVGLRDALDSLVEPLDLAVTSPNGPLGGALQTYRLYATRRGLVAVAALEPRFRSRLYETLELPPGSRLEEVFRGRTARQWEQWARRHDLPLAEVKAARRR